MADFQTQNPNLGKFWRALDWKMLIYLEYFTILWNILLSFGIFYYPLQGGQIGRLFTLGSGLKITEVAHVSGLLFTTVPVRYVILTKNGFGRLFHKHIWSP
jgi:hypothetical protein